MDDNLIHELDCEENETQRVKILEKNINHFNFKLIDFGGAKLLEN